MKTPSPNPAPPGRVASLHIHPPKPDAPCAEVAEINLVQEKGIREDARYFNRQNAAGEPSKRQVTLTEREVIEAHVTALNLPELPPGRIRSNIETEGIDLVALIGRKIRVGGAILHLEEARQPCAKMDAIAPGLREAMRQNRQGVIARVLASGPVKKGDPIHPL